MSQFYYQIQMTQAKLKYSPYRYMMYWLWCLEDTTVIRLKYYSGWMLYL